MIIKFGVYVSLFNIHCVVVLDMCYIHCRFFSYLYTCYEVYLIPHFILSPHISSTPKG